MRPICAQCGGWLRHLQCQCHLWLPMIKANASLRPCRAAMNTTTSAVPMLCRQWYMQRHHRGCTKLRSARLYPQSLPRNKMFPPLLSQDVLLILSTARLGSVSGHDAYRLQLATPALRPRARLATKLLSHSLNYNLPVSF